jgi:hypothetical protein
MSGIGLLFPSDPMNDRVTDPEFSAEAEEARLAGITVTLVDHNSLAGTEVSFRKLPEKGSTLVYRGWMTTAEEYANMYSALQSRNIQMLSTPENYTSAHHIVGWYTIFEEFTPKTIILPSDPDTKTILKFGAELGVEAFVVKDFVKSRKYEWDTACYSPDLAHLPSIVNEFICLQEEYLTGSVVIREFVKLDKTKPEVRVWWANMKPALITPHPDNPDAVIESIDIKYLALLQEKVKELDSSFITTDLAKDLDDNWVLIEVGDGQVSGLPSTASKNDIISLLVALTTE